MSVYKRPDQQTFSYDFQVRGHRFSGNTEATNRKDAEAVERDLKVKVKADIEAEKRTGNGPLLLRHAAGRYWDEVGQHHAGSATTFRDLERLVSRLGPNARLDQITDADVSALVAWRRKQTIKGKKGTATIAPATVNRSTLEPLKKIFTRAKRTWRYSFPLEPNWRDHWLKEPQERVRELHAGEGEALDAAARGDYAPWLAFARLTGLRRAETLLTWDCVNWEARTIVTTGKGGRTVSTPLTEAVAAILWPLRDHHPTAVFTYTAQRTRGEQVKGRRYPISYEGGKSEWTRMRKRAGVADLRFHDLRHDVATKLLRETGNLKLVQQALNHRDIKTTVRYAHVLNDEVAEALQRVADARKSHEKSHASNNQTS